MINSYGLVLDDDPWKYYELFSPKPVEEVSADELLVRVDSGCDIGQIFDDRGCDCRELLHTALAAIGVRSVFLQTDNRLKIAGIENAGIAVKRKPTNTTASRGAAHHIAAKHAFSGIYFTSHEEIE